MISRGVRSISRSFAHEYTVRKASSSKYIREINLPLNVSKMLKIVRSSKKPERWLSPPSERNTTTLTI